MSLPVVPAGQNPFAVYRAAIEASTRSTPTDGFAVRLVVLFVLCGLLAVLSTIYWLLLYRDWKRTGRGNPTWLFRIVERPSGRYIVTNLKLALTLFTVAASALLLAFIAETYQFYVRGGLRSHVVTFKTWSGVPLFVQGWLLIWSTLQASILATEYTQKTVLTARLANSLFVGLGIFISCAISCAAVYTNVVDAALWDQIVKVTTALGRLELSWTPSSDTFGPLLELGPEFRRLAAKSNYFRRVQLAILCILLIVPLIFLGVNIASLRLAGIISTHLKFNVDHLKQRAGAGICADASLTFDSNQTSGCASLLVPRHLSRRQLAELSHNAQNSADKQRVRHIQRLQKVQKELLITSCLALVMILSSIAFCIYSLHALATGHAQKLRWATNEAELLYLPWIYSITVNAVLISLLYVRWEGRSLHVEERDASWLDHSPVDRRALSGGPVLSAAEMSMEGRHRTTVIELDGGGREERTAAADKNTDGAVDEEKEVESSHLRLASSSTSSARS
ncbi:hypothetical protein NBRC10512_005431 [Rhodotorula toruloides]|uniref:RHTO0S22e01926g1_1 n=2 Tax=Rhodotorula toruloides TaxID=5286 RepID=A0A061BM51_RHOTO|nr:uncharacterized protein RHTO_05513 [Rhodotorula toruloides NP11]EMS18945.1 hypothetical protein RHTO_05513 [Rhodotorula toruloides NP11]CDR49044.1 RHTO0S22e01926g1_1 [Rhodotorula toruloides]